MNEFSAIFFCLLTGVSFWLSERKNQFVNIERGKIDILYQLIFFCRRKALFTWKIFSRCEKQAITFLCWIWAENGSQFKFRWLKHLPLCSGRKEAQSLEWKRRKKLNGVADNILSRQDKGNIVVEEVCSLLFSAWWKEVRKVFLFHAQFVIWDFFVGSACSLLCNLKAE